jgi:hypothetical protein
MQRGQQEQGRQYREAGALLQQPDGFQLVHTVLPRTQARAQ